MKGLSLCLVSLALISCAGVPAASGGPSAAPSSGNVQIPSDAFGAYLLSGQQGQAAEELFANQSVQPAITVWNLFGKSKVVVTPDGAVTAESEGVEGFGDSFNINPTVTIGDIEGGSNSSGGKGTAGTQTGGTDEGSGD